MKSISKYEYLSNDYPCKIELGGKFYPSAEHAYQACKTTSDTEQIGISFASTARKARSIVRKLLLRPDWDNTKIFYMLMVTTFKFQQNMNLYKKLMSTGNKDLTGIISKGKPNKYMGKVLVEVRDNLRKELAFIK